MAILQSCCFWKSVRKGSYASASYTLVYFGFSAIILLLYINEEQDYLAGKRRRPSGKSVLERGRIAPMTVIFNILFMTCSVFLVVSSILVIMALRFNKRQLMLPWIVFMVGDVLIELAHLIYLAWRARVIFEPVVGFLFTVDFFIMCLNSYCLLCVVSQYQEFRQGRGCERVRLTTPQIVLHTTAPTNTIRTTMSTESGYSHGSSSGPPAKLYKPNHLSVVSPFASSRQITHISTVPEEEEEEEEQNLAAAAQLNQQTTQNGDSHFWPAAMSISRATTATITSGDITGGTTTGKFLCVPNI